MKIRHFIIIMSAFLLTLFSRSVIAIVYAETEDNNDAVMEEYEEVKEKIKEYEEKLNELESEEQSLKSEISYADGQIVLTELRIEDTINEISKKTKKIEKLVEDIADLSTRIVRLEETVDFQKSVLNERLRARYKINKVSPIVMFFGSNNLQESVQKAEYLKVLELQDQKLLAEMVATRDDYSFQKDLYSKKKVEEEELKSQVEDEKSNLEFYQNDLEVKKQNKEELLEQTQNDEEKYQALLAQAQSELAALQMAINLPSGNGEEVEEGDIIGYMGNTGCSSGPHVHFGYVKNGKAKDPLPLLKEDDLEWPVDDYAITQYFGDNYDFYMRNFGIPGHDALDIISTSAWSGAPIKAAKDGVLYYAQDSKVYCPWLNNSIGKGAIIDHGDGERTIYWHLQ